MTTTRVPPHDLDLERAVLSAMLVNRNAILNVAELLDPADFYKPAHGLIYEAATTLWAEGEPVDPITVAAWLEAKQLVDAIGGKTYLTDLFGVAGASSSVAHYADLLVDLRKLRQLIGVGVEITELGYRPTDNAAAAVDQAEQHLFAMADTTRQRLVARLGDYMDGWLDRLADRQRTGHVAGVPTGITDLDTILLGLQPGQLVVAAGRPGMGKSALAQQVAANVGREGFPVYLASIEMSVEEVVNRLAAAHAGVPLQNIRSANITPRDWERLGHATVEMRSLPIDIDDAATGTLMTVRGGARRTASRYGSVSLIVVDYIQLLDSVGRHNTREAEVAEVARGLKKLAMELQVPVLALAQLNRSVEQRADKRPMLSDLRESGEIENAADVVLFLYRDDYYHPESKDRGILELIVAKQRNGPTGTAKAAYQAPVGRIANMVRA